MRYPRAWAVAIGLSLVVSAMWPVGMRAAHLWSIATSTSSLTQHVSAAVGLTVTNLSGNNGGGESIGCVRVFIPSDYTVAGASVDSVTNGYIWSASTSGSDPTVVTFNAAGDGDRLRGDPDFDVLQATITVTPTGEGDSDWSATEWEKDDCTQEQLSQVLPMTVAAGGNSVPTATADAYSVVAGDTLSVPGPGVLGNDDDADGDPLEAVLVSDVSDGSLSLALDGSFTYTPDAGFSGFDGFTYVASDPSSSSPTTAVVIDVTNAIPTAGDDAYGVQKNVALVVDAAAGVLADDADADPAQTLTAVLDSGPASGDLSLDGDGGFSYLPAPGFVGTASFTYRVSDGVATSSLATVTLTVTNQDPVAGDDAYAIHMGQPLVVGPPGVLGDDADANGDGLTAELVSGPTDGLLVLDPDGSFTYLPGLLFVGLDTFTYRVTDGSAYSAAATVQITVGNGAPVANDDTATTVHDASVGGNVLANDTDPDGDAMSASLVATATNGSLTLQADGAWSYLPDPGFVGTDTFSYRADDGVAFSGTATVTVTVTNATPMAGDDVAATHHDVALVVGGPGVLANDVDADGDTLIAGLASFPSHGTVALAGDGSYTYTPDAGYVGPDAFTYVVSDGIALSTPAIVTIDVTDGAPVAGADAWSLVHDRTLTIGAPGVLFNDTDVDDDPLLATVVSPPAHGVLTLTPQGAFSFVPDGGFVGADSFAYEVTDGALSAVGVVSLSITNAAPVAGGDTYTVEAGSDLVVAAPSGVLADDGDADGDALSAVLVTSALHGTVTLSASGAFVYGPGPGFAGIDTFTYVATDGLAVSAPATVTITVDAPLPLPTPVPTPLVTPSPTPESSPAPTPAQTPLPTPAATADPSPSPSETPQPSPSGPVAPPTPPPGAPGPSDVVDAFTIGPSPGDDADGQSFPILGLAADTLGLFGRAFEWLVPGALVTVPGLLLVIVVVAQSLGALAWLPLVRRTIGSFGVSGRRPARRP